MKRTEGSFHMLGTPLSRPWRQLPSERGAKKMKCMAYIGVYEKPTRGF